MKTISLPWFLFWMCCLVLVAFAVGRHFERTTALQDDVGDLKERVDQLEIRNIRHEDRWGLITKFVSWIPIVGHLFRRN
jgi:hypothetical protein